MIRAASGAKAKRDPQDRHDKRGNALYVDLNHHAEHPLEPALPESLERRCPCCKSERIAPGGRITAGAGMITLELRCEVCGVAFLIAGKPLA